MFALFSQNSLVILSLMLVGVLGYATVLQLRFDAAKAQIETMTFQESMLQTDLETLRGVIRTQNDQQRQMMNEFNLLAELNKANAQAKKALSSELNQQMQLLDNLMEADNGEANVWATEPVPVDVSRVLEYASDCANTALQPSRVCFTAQKYDSQVSDPAIFKQ
ncbi:hypothetical protein [uncultured Shewanella sp.]|uniref:hypothetical protein n=1 Tax=uncultured Shewanella sp. TaxID=173975 RepID=UPI002610790C|nr:hypothetical protein [uncultured Shewanella sp.]